MESSSVAWSFGLRLVRGLGMPIAWPFGLRAVAIAWPSPVSTTCSLQGGCREQVALFFFIFAFVFFLFVVLLPASARVVAGPDGRQESCLSAGRGGTVPRGRACRPGHFVPGAAGAVAPAVPPQGLATVHAKIENKEGLKNFGAIIVSSDSVMVAYSDFGMEILPVKVSIFAEEDDLNVQLGRESRHHPHADPPAGFPAGGVSAHRSASRRAGPLPDGWRRYRAARLRREPWALCVLGSWSGRANGTSEAGGREDRARSECHPSGTHRDRGFVRRCQPVGDFDPYSGRSSTSPRISSTARRRAKG